MTVAETVPEHNRRYTLVVAFFIFCTIIAAILKVLYGWDQDESYNMILTYKMLSGEIMFKDLWDLHQTSAVIPAIIAMPYISIVGSTFRMAIFLRIVTTLIQFLVAIIVYRIIKKWYGEYAALFSAILIANMLTRQIVELEYGLTSILCSIICCVILLDIWKSGKEKEYVKIAISGLFYALSIFVYPTMVITLPILFYILLFKINDTMKVRTVYFCVFFGICLFLMIYFLSYLFKYVSLRELIGIIRELGNESYHPVRFAAFHNIPAMIKSGSRIIAILIIVFVLYLASYRHLKDTRYMVYICMGITTMFVIVLNVSKIRPSGPFGFLERYIACVVLTSLFARKTEEKPIFWLFYMVGIGYYFGAIMGSALGFNENAMYLESSMIAMIIWSVYHLHEIVDGDKKRILTLGMISLFVFGIIFSKGYFRRVNKTVPANVFECDTMLDEGSFAGIIVDDSQYSDYKAHINELIDSNANDKLAMYVGNDPIYNFFLNKTTSPMYVGTALPNSVFVDYFVEYGHELPDMIYVDKDRWRDLDDFYNQEFGKYAKAMYYDYTPSYFKHFYVLKRFS